LRPISLKVQLVKDWPDVHQRSRAHILVRRFAPSKVPSNPTRDKLVVNLFFVTWFGVFFALFGAFLLKLGNDMFDVELCATTSAKTS
jgi:hypothetical protein